MDTPIYDQVLGELLARWSDPPTVPGFVLPPEMFRVWPPAERSCEGVGRGLARSAVVAVWQG